MTADLGPLIDVPARSADDAWVGGLALNSLYALKLRLVAQQPGEREGRVRLEFGHVDLSGRFWTFDERELDLPVVSDADADFAQRGRWYEQFLFFSTNENVNALRWQGPGETDVAPVVRVARIVVLYPQVESFRRTLAGMAERRTRLRGREYQPFLGMESATAYLDALNEAIAPGPRRLPHLRGQFGERDERVAGPRVGLVGDDLLAGLLDSSAACVKLTPDNLALVRDDRLDLIMVQRRAVGIGPQGMSDAAEAAYLADLSSALSVTRVPIVELADDPRTPVGVTLRPLRNSELDIEVAGSEYELARFEPVRGPLWNSRNIAIPCVSDLYQYTEFQEAANKLVDNGFSLALSETNFDHVPVRTWERFESPRVKSFGRLSPRAQSAVFQSCGFALVPGRSLRPLADVVNLCTMALQSGALPIVFGDPLPAPLDLIAESANGLDSLHAYLSQFSEDLVRERHWVKRFRQFVARSAQGRLCDALQDFTAGRRIARAGGTLPSAELICISKRPENLDIIAENYLRQRYPNLGIHLIWNVPAETAQHCVDQTDRMNLPNMRVSVLDEAHNIGSCLNYGRRQSLADFWFKFDDDDYYGANYVGDSVNYYRWVGADAVAKPAGFVHFKRSQEVFVRNLSGVYLWHLARTFPDRPYLCGATLSGRRASDLPLFSTNYRNSCDSKWMESLPENNFRIFASDPFNHVIFRGDASSHTWQASEQMLTNNSRLLASRFVAPTFDAE
ncbi:hypothetical protein [Piscinibacter defluvii]|uniref:hypothetical protein n=1 Tax=Piscinibacter defluvii TaxID=1796922 RepID=UPI000FDE3585|nr:hypothetical protein [Piscinibacter defluvii]